MPEQVGTYTVELHCHNCGDARFYELDKGTRVVSAPCEHCGVKQLKRVAWIDRKIDDEEEL